MSCLTPSILILILSIFVNVNHGAILFTTKTTLFENNTINFSINTDLNLVNIELTTLASTPNSWKGFGFDSSSMFGTYAIIVDYTFPEQIPIVFETILGSHTIGTIYTIPQITILSDTNDGITRIVNLQRSINGSAYSFPTTPRTLNIISAIGQQFNFARCSGQRQAICQHIPVNGRNIKSLFLTQPTISPTNEPSLEPTLEPTFYPTFYPTTSPTIKPSNSPSNFPSNSPSKFPTNFPSKSPSKFPTNSPTKHPTNIPSKFPSNSPTKSPTNIPSTFPTTFPTKLPTNIPTISPTLNPSNSPTLYPTLSPTFKPTRKTKTPTQIPTTSPSIYPTNNPSLAPTLNPTQDPFTIICDDDANCNAQLKTCSDFSGEYCDLNCVANLSCFETVFICPNAANCAIFCSAAESCSSLHIIAGVNSVLNISCLSASACISSNIDAADGHKLDITCFGEESCNQMTMKCPSSYSDESVCKITGISDKLVANQIFIYAEQSWNAMDISSYLPIETQVFMFCAGDSCTLSQANTSWNCLETDSLCFISETQEFEDIICAQGEADCVILCNSGSGSCKYRNIYAAPDSHSLSIQCNDTSSCMNSDIFAADVMYLYVECAGFESCKNTNFYAQDTSLLTIHCSHMDGSCQDMNVYCPHKQNDKVCVISNEGGKANDIHTNLDFYAIHGFDDLDVSNYAALLVMEENNENITNMMHCGSDYESFCKLNESLLCNCDYGAGDDEIIIKKEDEDKGEETVFYDAVINNIQIAAIVISTVILATIFGVVGFCVFCDIKRKKKVRIVGDNKSVNINNTINVDGKSYESVKINNTTNVEMQHIQPIQTDDDDEEDVVLVDDYEQTKKT